MQSVVLRTMMDVVKSPENCDLDIDFSSLSADESEHILHVIHQDFLLRYLEKDRLCDIESQLQEDDLKTKILAQHYELNNKMCIRCLSRFFVFFNKRYTCSFCSYFVCKRCCEYSPADNSYICKVCTKQSELRRQASDWFYSSVCKKFKRCGSAKVIWHFYHQRLLHSQSTDSVGAVSDWLDFMKGNNVTNHCQSEYQLHYPVEYQAASTAGHDNSGCDCPSCSDVVCQHDISSRTECRPTVSRPANLDLLTYPASTPPQDVDLSAMECGRETLEFPHNICSQENVGHRKHSSKYCNDNRLLKLAEDVLGTQGKTSSLAEKMLDSASLIQLMSEKLDEMDESLHGLQTHLSALEQNIDDSDQQETSLDAMSGLTSTALNVLSYASDVLHNDPYFTNTLDEQQNETIFTESTSNAGLQWTTHGAGDADHVSVSAAAVAGVAADDDTITSVIPTDAAMSENVFKTIEKQIYMTSSQVFLLEEHIQQLETQVLSTDETSSHDIVTALESEIARTVARVANTSCEVSDIELQIKAIFEHQKVNNN